MTKIPIHRSNKFIVQVAISAAYFNRHHFIIICGNMRLQKSYNLTALSNKNVQSLHIDEHGLLLFGAHLR